MGQSNKKIRVRKCGDFVRYTASNRIIDICEKIIGNIYYEADHSPEDYDLIMRELIDDYLHFIKNNVINLSSGLLNNSAIDHVKGIHKLLKDGRLKCYVKKKDLLMLKERLK